MKTWTIICFFVFLFVFFLTLFLYLACSKRSDDGEWYETIPSLFFSCSIFLAPCPLSIRLELSLSCLSSPEISVNYNLLPRRSTNGSDDTLEMSLLFFEKKKLKSLDWWNSFLVIKEKQLIFFIIFMIINVGISIIVIVIVKIICSCLFIKFFLFIYSHYGTISTERSQTISVTRRMHRNAYYFTLNYLYIFASISNRLDQSWQHIREHGPRKRHLKGPEHLKGPTRVVPWGAWGGPL